MKTGTHREKKEARDKLFLPDLNEKHKNGFQRFSKKATFIQSLKERVEEMENIHTPTSLIDRNINKVGSFCIDEEIQNGRDQIFELPEPAPTVGGFGRIQYN